MYLITIYWKDGTKQNHIAENYNTGDNCLIIRQEDEKMYINFLETKKIVIRDMDVNKSDPGPGPR